MKRHLKHAGGVCAAAILILAVTALPAACGGATASTPSSSPSAVASSTAGTPSPSPTALATLTDDEMVIYELVKTDFPKVKTCHDRYSKAYRLEAIDVRTHYQNVSHFNQGIAIGNATNDIWNPLVDAWAAQDWMGGNVDQLEQDYDDLLSAIHDLDAKVGQVGNMKTGTAAATQAENGFAAMLARHDRKIHPLIAAVEADLAEIEANFQVE